MYARSDAAEDDDFGEMFNRAVNNTYNFEPFNFEHAWPGHDEEKSTNNPRLVQVTHKTTNTSIQLHSFMVRWMREYCAFWDAHYEDDADLLDALSSLNMSAQEFRTFWKMCYCNISSYKFEKSESLNIASLFETIIQNIILPQLIFIRGMYQLVKSDKWFQTIFTSQMHTYNSLLYAEYLYTLYRAIHNSADAVVCDFSDGVHHTSSSGSATRSSEQINAEPPSAQQWHDMGKLLAKIMQQLAFESVDGDGSLTAGVIVEDVRYSVSGLSKWNAFYKCTNDIISKSCRSESASDTVRATNAICANGYVWHGILDVMSTPGFPLPIHFCIATLTTAGEREKSGYSFSRRQRSFTWHTVISEAVARSASLELFSVHEPTLIAHTVDIAQRSFKARVGNRTRRARDTEYDQTPKLLVLSPLEPDFVIRIDNSPAGNDAADNTGVFRIHSVVLSQWSYFKRMISVGGQEVADNQIVLPSDFPLSVLATVLAVMHGVEMTDPIATNNNTIATIMDDDDVSFLLNEFVHAYDMVDDVPLGEEDVGYLLGKRLSLVDRQNFEQAQKRQVAKARRGYRSFSDDDQSYNDVYTDDDDDGTEALAVVTKNKETFTSTVPKLVTPCLKNAPRLAAAFATLVDMVVVMTRTRSQHHIGQLMTRQVVVNEEGE